MNPVELLKGLVTDDRVTVRSVAAGPPSPACVLLWMQRSQRVNCNYALSTAIEVADALRLPLIAAFRFMPGYKGANLRHLDFMLQGLAETAGSLRQLGVGFAFLGGEMGIAEFSRSAGAALVVGDENYAREMAQMRRELADSLPCPFVTVDSDVVVPTKFFPKEEYAARTLRPKINALVPRFLVPVTPRPPAVTCPTSLVAGHQMPPVDKLLADPRIDWSVVPVKRFVPGEAAASARLHEFCAGPLTGYDSDRNHPEFAGATSLMSPYLHFGQISPVTVALAAKQSGAPAWAVDAFVEELIVRRELAVNFVARNPHYDSFEGLHEWAKRALLAHADDEREYLYSEAELDNAQTHDPLWNAAQLELKHTGYMAGYVRMYWGKKILEWTAHPADAHQRAIALNDRYLLDGRDPNGWTGVAWAIGGKHDRPWTERPIFGMIRYMSFASTSRKFNYKAYVRRVSELLAAEGRTQ